LTQARRTAQIVAVGMDPEAEAAQRVGTTLCNKWTLERLIGTGGMAAVYVATHKIGRREAIKILHSDVARDPDLRARFEQEAHAVNRFKHPGAVEVRDIDVAEDGSPFLVMELLEGRPLSELQRAPGGVHPGALLGWVDELLDVLAAAHAQGIIHRDIKPDNLFVLRDGHLKVLDFGIARVRAGVSSKPQTRVGAALGTAPYMPPEQIRGVEIDGRADLFAVGATMFRLIAHRRIHEAPTAAELLLQMARLPAPALASVAPHAPANVCLVVDRALMFDREQRYPDALTMQRDVRAVREGRSPAYAVDRLGDGPTAPGTNDPRAPGSSIVRKAPIAEGASSAQGVQTSPATKVGGPASATKAASPVALHAPDEHAAPPAALELAASPKAEEHTLKSVAGPEANGAAVEPQGYPVPEAAMPAPLAAPRAGGARGPRTQLSGVAEPAPGESIPVVDAPPPRRRTLPGSDVSVWPLVLVGVVFAAIGVTVTLLLMLQDAPDATVVPATSAEHREQSPHPATHPAPHQQPPHDHSPGLSPQHGPSPVH
jgi:serine/threonine-protein kinase